MENKDFKTMKRYGDSGLKGKCECGEIIPFTASKFKEDSTDNLVFKEPFECFKCGEVYDQLKVKSEEVEQVKNVEDTKKMPISKVFNNLSILFYVLSGILIILGFVEMFVYPDYDAELDIGSSFNHIVGGDAYNFIIIGIRGLGYIITGVCFSIVASTFLIVSSIRKSYRVSANEEN